MFDIPVKDMTLAELGNHLRHWKQVKADAAEEERAAGAKAEEAELEIYNRLKVQELDRFTTGGYNFKPKVESFPRVNKAKEWDFNGWLFEKNFRLTVHNPSLRGWYNAHSDEYLEELLEKDYLAVFEKIKVSVTKA